MDYQKSYVLMWVGMIVGIILVAVGAGLEIGMAVLPLPPLRQTLGYPRRRSPLLPGVRGVHLVKCFHNGKTRPLCLQQSGLAILEQAV